MLRPYSLLGYKLDFSNILLAIVLALAVEILKKKIPKKKTPKKFQEVLQ
jgi:hypothetical protein